MLLTKGAKTMFIIVFTMILVVVTIIYIVFTRIGNVVKQSKVRFGQLLYHRLYNFTIVSQSCVTSGR